MFKICENLFTVDVLALIWRGPDSQTIYENNESVCWKKIRARVRSDWEKSKRKNLATNFNQKNKSNNKNKKIIMTNKTI